MTNEGIFPRLHEKIFQLIHGDTLFPASAEFWAIATIIVGIIGLCGWITSLRPLVAILPQSVLFAPSSALLFIFLGLCLLIHKKTKSESIYSGMYHSILFISLTIDIWVNITHFFKGFSDINWQIYTAEQVSWITPQGQMSPISGILFLFLITGLMFGHYVPLYAKIVSILTISIAAVIITGYWFGVPLFYGGDIKPMSFLAASGFFLCGISFSLITYPSAIQKLRNYLRIQFR